MQALHWDVFCRVVDNFGDIGVCWRLAADLAARGQQVRLWVDDADPLGWMAPAGSENVEVLDWHDAATDFVPADVVIEAFGCELPVEVVRRMGAASRSPLWINLEYLSAEAFVERSHRLGSPQAGAGVAGLRKVFFYPGFTSRTGGLIRESDLAERQSRFDAPRWLADRDLLPSPGERVVSLFCYAQPALPALVSRLSREPTLLLATAGLAARQLTNLLGSDLSRGELRAVALDRLSQRDYDHLLWASDLNLVRGEDSFVRAQWAGKPFVWQIYPQHDGAHQAKLDAFLERFDGTQAVADFWRAWNAGSSALPPLPEALAWTQQCERWRATLWAQVDLTTQLIEFAREPR